MTSLAALAFAFLSTVQSGELRPEWKEQKLFHGDPVRYLVVRNPAPEGAKLRPVLCLPTAGAESALEAAAVLVARAAGPATLVVVPAVLDTAHRCAVYAVDDEVKSGTVDARQRSLIVAEGAGAERALACLAWEPDMFAGALLLAPPVLSPSELDSFSEATAAPLSIVRGRQDDNAGCLALLEQRLEQGAETQLDFASTCEHASIACNEGYLGRRLGAFLAAEERRSAAETAIRAVLERFHGAAAKADGKEYFACLAPDAIFIGTDASERWTVPQFRAFCEPYFSKGKGWTYTASERHVYLAPDLRTAWFDERLDNESYGKVRGSGVLRLDGERWRITQYVLSIPVPNELAKDLVQRIRERR
ncbi:MAG: nuclear transport factor 2 family protein [Planctomycetota bacterium]|nr:nuclear transport factor 2 family protein [Planctomycetota bacterium]